MHKRLHSVPPTGRRRRSVKTKPQFIAPFLGGLFGALLSLGGIWLQDRLTNSNELKRAEREALLATLTLNDYENKPEFIVLSQQAMVSIRYATYSNAESLREHAAFLRKNKFCENELTEDCKRTWVETVAAHRRQLGLDPLSYEDLRLLLDHPLNQLETALNMGRKFGVTGPIQPAKTP